jgi:ankyrin repeat protein
MGDRRPLGSRFQDCCRQTREGGGLPEGSIIPAGITHDLVLLIDGPARRMEREERLLAMHGGNVNATLYDLCIQGGGQDARFLLAHGADANYEREPEIPVLARAAYNGHLAVVEALLDAGAGRLGPALLWAADRGHTAIISLLLDRGADVHHDGALALIWTVNVGHLQTATLLLDRGVTASIHHLTLAVERGHHAIADLLRAHGAV